MRKRDAARAAAAGLAVLAGLLLSAPGKAGEENRLRLVAHRGLLRHAPENTLAAFGACLDLGLGFEVDLQRSRDGALVCIHDATVDRTTNGRGRVDGMSLAELKRLDAGSWFDPAFGRERIPSLAEVLELVRARRSPDTVVAMDFKGEDERIEADMVTAAKRAGVLDSIVAIGRAITLPEVRRRLRAADPRARAARLAADPGELAGAASDPDADWVYVRFVPTREQVRAVRRAGRRIFLAGPLVAQGQPGNWKLAREAGVDALLTDEPLEVRRLFRAPPGG